MTPCDCASKNRNVGWTLDQASGIWVCAQCRRPSAATIESRREVRK